MFEFDCIIHTNKFNHLPALVCKYVLQKHNPGIRVFIEYLEDYELLIKQDLNFYHRDTGSYRLNISKSQSFFMVRFLATEKYKIKMGDDAKKWILIIDPDIFCLKNIIELNSYIKAAEDTNKFIIACKKLHYTDMKFNSSLMLVNVSLISWEEESFVSNIFDNNENLDNYMFLKKYLDNILELPGYWNEQDTINDESCFLHTTNTITQPWKEGVSVNESDLHNSLFLTPGKQMEYRTHPDERVRQKVKELFNETQGAGLFSTEDVRQAIENKQLAPDQITTD